MSKSIPPLQHLPSADPLATLFNDWLTGLRPVQEFAQERPGKYDVEDERTRQLLQEATTVLHGLHHNITKAIKLLGQGASLTMLKPMFRRDRLRTCIGTRQAESLQPLIFYVEMQARITSRREYKRLLRYTPAYQNRLIDQANLPPALDRTVGLFLAVFDAAIEADDYFYSLQPEDEQGRACLLADLQGILSLECFERVTPLV
jgi:hypothetical protein